MDGEIKSVLFDIDNTLYDYDSADAQTQIKNHVEKISGKDTAVIHNRLIRFQKMLENQHIPLMPHAISLYNTYWDTLISSMELSDGITDYIKSLKQNGIRIGIATDMTAHIQFRKLEKLSLLSFVDFVVTSEEAGCEKPDKFFYELCIEKAGCLPEECLMIGDSLEKDVLGAKTAEMQTMRFHKGMTLTIPK